MPIISLLSLLFSCFLPVAATVRVSRLHWQSRTHKSLRPRAKANGSTMKVLSALSIFSLVSAQVFSGFSRVFQTGSNACSQIKGFLLESLLSVFTSLPGATVEVDTKKTLPSPASQILCSSLAPSAISGPRGLGPGFSSKRKATIVPP